MNASKCCKPMNEFLWKKSYLLLYLHLHHAGRIWLQHLILTYPYKLAMVLHELILRMYNSISFVTVYNVLVTWLVNVAYSLDCAVNWYTSSLIPPSRLPEGLIHSMHLELGTKITWPCTLVFLVELQQTLLQWWYQSMITWFIEVMGFLILQLLWMGELFYNINFNCIFIANRIKL